MYISFPIMVFWGWNHLLQVLQNLSQRASPSWDPYGRSLYISPLSLKWFIRNSSSSGVKVTAGLCPLFTGNSESMLYPPVPACESPVSTMPHLTQWPPEPLVSQVSLLCDILVSQPSPVIPLSSSFFSVSNPIKSKRPEC